MTENCPIATPEQQKQGSLGKPQSPTDLLQLLRRFLDDLGAVLSDETRWSREMIEKSMKEGVLKYCQQKSTLISRFEYGGSLYENLKILGPDEEDAIIHVVLKAKKGFANFDVHETCYALIKAVDGSPYKEFSNDDGLLMPKKFKSWLSKLVTSAMQGMTSSNGASSVSFKVSSCTTGVKVKTSDQSKALEIQLVPTFQSSNEYFIPPPQHGYLPGKVISEDQCRRLSNSEL